MKYIPDSLHNEIEVNDIEREVLDTTYMQRLRRVNQLGLSSVVYPDATHSRFIHSLGVMHLAGRFAETLNMDEQDVQNYRLAGLLHDVGHGPFSHASERLLYEKTGKSHEDYSCELVEKIDVEISYDIDVKTIQEIIKGETYPRIVNGAIDVDRMDYLCRDSTHTGVELGRVDVEALIRFASLDDEGVLVFEQKALQALEGLLIARFHMYRSVYAHHTSRISEAMLEAVLTEYVEQNSVEDILWKDDYEMHTDLLRSGGIITEMYSRLAERNLYKVAYVYELEGLSRGEKKTLLREIADDQDAFEQDIADELGVSQHEVIVDIPHFPREEPLPIQVNKRGKVYKLTELSEVPKDFLDYEWNSLEIQVYTPESCREEAENVAEKVLPVN